MATTLTLPRNFRLHLCLIFTSLLLIVIPVLNKIPTQEVADRASRAAAHFLFLVDTEEYGQSWEVTSEALKNILSKKAWDQEITKLRSFLGPVVERIYHNIAYTDSAIDVPEGEYVVMTFISKFELRERVVETITLMLSDSGQWRVAGYFLR